MWHWSTCWDFASAGCGKTVLMHMLVNNTELMCLLLAWLANVEGKLRNAGVAEKISKCSKMCFGLCHLCFSSVDRCNAALMATTVAEYLEIEERELYFLSTQWRGMHETTRYEAGSGWTTCQTWLSCFVFDSLPRLLERPGPTLKGSILRFIPYYWRGRMNQTHWVMNSLNPWWPYLSKSQTRWARSYPAIDVLKSVSRVFGQVTDENTEIMLRG